MPSYSNPAAVVDSGSMSSVFTETESGWHVVKIERYSQTKGVLGVGACFKSTVFSAGGHRWCIGYYADGYADDTDDCIGFELFLVDHPDHDADADVKAKFVFTLLDQAGQPVAAYTAASEVGTFSSAVPSWGFESFIERTELESKYLHDDDSFSVRCDVTVYKDSRRENLITATPPPPPPSRSCARVAVRLILWLILLVACRVVFGYIC